MARFITYNNQSAVAKEIYDQEYAYANIGEEDVRYVSKSSDEQILYYSIHPAGNSGKIWGT